MLSTSQKYLTNEQHEEDDELCNHVESVNTSDETLMNDDELFKTIKKYPIYEVNKQGLIRNTRTGHLLSQQKDDNGYMRVCLYMFRTVKMYVKQFINLLW